MMGNVNIELYEFLKKCETSLTKIGEKGEVTAVALVDFSDIEKFQKAVGSGAFSENDFEVILCEGHIGVTLNYIFERELQFIWDYRYCFPADDLEEYAEDLKKEKKDYEDEMKKSVEGDGFDL